MVFSNMLYRGVLRYLMRFHSDAITDLSHAATLTPEHSAVALFNRSGAVCHEASKNIKQVRLVGVECEVMKQFFLCCSHSSFSSSSSSSSFSFSFFPRQY